jgi:hypothetical protein
MFRMGIIALIMLGAVSTIATLNAAAAAKCTGLKARCAVEAGGQCNPVTGRWVVHKEGAGGTVQGFIACLDRERRNNGRFVGAR